MTRLPAARLLVLAAVLAAGLVLCGAGTSSASRVRVPARVQGGQIAVLQNGAYRTRFWAGVNLGSTFPGHLPGEVVADRAVYDRWLREMGELGVSVVRVYTILRPPFYDALASYDRAHPDHPIRLLQGIWIPEDEFLAKQDAWAPGILGAWKSEIHDAVAVVHGDADLPLRPGHAGGRYRSDVAPWLLAWSPGVEWDPFASEATDRKNRGRPHYVGRYVTTSARATPMEDFIAAGVDYLASLEAARGWSEPLTFTNWLTVDPLHHPYEPLAQEDLVTIDATHFRATARWPGGFFASYHAYPYYPDFLRRTPAYTRAPDPYAAYLHALRAHHGKQAVMITEFGVPASIGIAHRGPLGRDQGGHSEREAARMDATMLKDIRTEGYAGGMLFEWADEWFKFTWNTVDYERPAERRQLWRNPLTNEEHFGVVALEPGKRAAAVLDGSDAEWTRNGSQVIAESRGPVREVRAVKDEEYLYLRLRLDEENSWRSAPIRLWFDLYPAKGAEVRVTIGPGDRARIEEDSSIEPLLYEYGLNRHYLRTRPKRGVWVVPTQILNRPYVVPATKQRFPIELAPHPWLRWGTTDPRSPSFDDRNLAFGAGKVVELRVPWSYLGFADPSSLQLLVPHRDGTLTTIGAKRVGIVVTAPGQRLATRGYAWSPWNRVTWHERRKAGWATLREAFTSA